jgi:thiamine biosynthesis lipoprotein
MPGVRQTINSRFQVLQLPYQVRSGGRATLSSRKVLAVVLFLSLAIAAGYRVVSAPHITEVSRTFTALGTFATVIVTAENHRAQKLLNEVDSLLNSLDTKLGRFSHNGELYCLNTTCHITTGTELAGLVQISDSLVKATCGSFDPSLGALSELWGFPEASSVPDSACVLQALTRTGWENRVHIGMDSIVIDQGTVMDFGAIAKGYAVDRAYELMIQHGAVECLVEVGGEIRCGSTTGRVWNVGIRHPRNNNLLGVLAITSGAVATSGDYECFFFEDGTRYSHLLDRGTGYPSGNSASATVVAEDCTTADAVATAAAVAGPEGAVGFSAGLYNSMLIVTVDNDNRCEKHEFGDLPWAE